MITASHIEEIADLNGFVADGDKQVLRSKIIPDLSVPYSRVEIFDGNKIRLKRNDRRAT